MSESDTTPPIQVHLSEPPLSKFERERRAFYRLLPDLLATHRNQYVAIHDEQVVDSRPGSDDKTIKLWDIATGKERATLEKQRKR